MASTASSWKSAWMVVVLAAAGACNNAPTSNPSNNSGASAAAPATPSKETIQLKIVDKTGFDEAIANQQGQVVLVDFWATWCEPCKERLPHMLELGAQNKDYGLTLVTMSCDDAAERDKVARFLAEQEAYSAVNLLTALDVNATFEAYDIDGAIPFYYLYDRAGKLRYRFNMNPTESDQAESVTQIEMRVGELLKEQL